MLIFLGFFFDAQKASGRSCFRTRYPERMMSTIKKILKKCCQPSQPGKPIGADSGSSYSPGYFARKEDMKSRPASHRAASTTNVTAPTIARATTAPAPIHWLMVNGPYFFDSAAGSGAGFCKGGDVGMEPACAAGAVAAGAGSTGSATGASRGGTGSVIDAGESEPGLPSGWRIVAAGACCDEVAGGIAGAGAGAFRIGAAANAFATSVSAGGQASPPGLRGSPRRASPEIVAWEPSASAASGARVSAVLDGSRGAGTSGCGARPDGPDVLLAGAPATAGA